MSSRHKSEEAICTWMEQEEKVRQKIIDGIHWKKMYSGSGEHYKRWLEQYYEVYGQENVMVEEAEVMGLACYQESGGKIYRIWVKDRT